MPKYKIQETSVRSRLERMRPGDTAVFELPDRLSMPTWQSRIATALANHLCTIKHEYTQRSALLVFDRNTLPVACTIVTRQLEPGD